MKRRVLALLLATVTALSLVACGGGQQQGGNNTQTPGTETPGTEEQKPTQDLSNITDTFGINDEGSYVKEGNKITATTDKPEWGFFSYMINVNAKEMNAVKIEIEDGTPGAVIKLKLEAGEVRAVEKDFVLTGGAQTIIWNVSKDNMTEVGGEKLVVFMAPGKYIDAGKEEFVTIKSVGLINNPANLTDVEYACGDAGAYVKENNVIKATTEKGEWSCMIYEIAGDATAYNTVVFDVENAVAGLEIMLKLEGEGVTAVEQRFTLSGGRETIEWPVAAENFSAEGKGKLVIFVAPGAYLDADAHITVNGLSLATK